MFELANAVFYALHNLKTLVFEKYLINYITLKSCKHLMTIYLVKLGQHLEFQIHIMIKIINIFCNVNSVNHNVNCEKHYR